MTTPPSTSLVPGWARIGPCEYANSSLPGYRIVVTYDGFRSSGITCPSASRRTPLRLSAS